MLLRLDILFLSRKQIVSKELLLHVLESDPCDSICETLPCDPLLAEQKDRFLNNREHFVLVGKYFIEISSLRHFLAPASADVDAVSVRCLLYTSPSPRDCS